MKKLNFKISLILFLLIIFISTALTFSNASYDTVSMSVVDEPTATINFGTNSYVERSVIAKDLDNKEITIQLKVTNNENSVNPSGELILVIDNSKSMSDSVTTTQTRGDLVSSSAQSLIDKLLTGNEQLKIGIVSFSANSATNEGTINDAKLISNLTDDANELKTAISNISFNGARTNLDSGITLAKQYFTDDTDKSHRYIIILSDGVPNIAIDNINYYSDEVINKTKSSLQSLSSVSNNIIVMLTGITSGSAIAAPSTKTYDQIISEIFGTTSSPTIGKFYYISDDKVEDTIVNNIYKDLLPVSVSLTDIKVVDTFSQEIVDNFDFSYVKDPNYGTISEKIDTATNSITWNIPELKSNETAIVQYKLKLKEGFDENIIDKVLDTHTDLSITYTDYASENYTKTSDVTPKINLTDEPEEELPKVYPKAGKNAILGIAIFSILCVTFLGSQYIYNKNKLK